MLSAFRLSAAASSPSFPPSSACEAGGADIAAFTLALSAFNRFLPEGYRIECLTGEVPRPAVDPALAARRRNAKPPPQKKPKQNE